MTSNAWIIEQQGNHGMTEGEFCFHRHHELNLVHAIASCVVVDIELMSKRELSY